MRGQVKLAVGFALCCAAGFVAAYATSMVALILVDTLHLLGVPIYVALFSVLAPTPLAGAALIIRGGGLQGDLEIGALALAHRYVGAGLFVLASVAGYWWIAVTLARSGF